MKRGALVTLIALAVAAAFAFPQEASAKKRKKGGIIVYQNGYDIFPAGALPAPFDKATKLAGYRAGYKCKIFGFFWAYVTISNCEPVAYRGTQFYSHPKLAAAISAKYKPADMKVSFWNKHGRWVLLMMVLGGIGVFAVRRFRKKDD